MASDRGVYGSEAPDFLPKPRRLYRACRGLNDAHPGQNPTLRPSREASSDMIPLTPLTGGRILPTRAVWRLPSLLPAWVVLASGFRIRRRDFSMNRNAVAVMMVIVVLAGAALACGGSFTTANIKDAYMSTDVDGATKTTAYSPDSTFYAQVELANAPDDTKLKAIWFAVNAEGVEANFQIEESEITSGDGLVHFELSNDNAWPAGQYKVDIYMNDVLTKTVGFDVQ